MPDYLEDNVFVFIFIDSPYDVDSFVETMNRALSDKIKAQFVGLNGRKVAELNFSKDVQINRLVKFLYKNK